MWTGQNDSGRPEPADDNSVSHWGGTSVDETNPAPPEQKYPGRVKHGGHAADPESVWDGARMVAASTEPDPDAEPPEPVPELTEGIWTGAGFEEPPPAAAA